jgi:hypothetical protein
MCAVYSLFDHCGVWIAKTGFAVSFTESKNIKTS